MALYFTPQGFVHGETVEICELNVIAIPFSQVFMQRIQESDNSGLKGMRIGEIVCTTNFRFDKFTEAFD